MPSLKSIILAVTAVTGVLAMPFADLHEAELRERGEDFNETLLEKRYTTPNSVGTSIRGLYHASGTALSNMLRGNH